PDTNNDAAPQQTPEAATRVSRGEARGSDRSDIGSGTEKRRLGLGTRPGVLHKRSVPHTVQTLRRYAQQTAGGIAGREGDSTAQQERQSSLRGPPSHATNNRGGQQCRGGFMRRWRWRKRSKLDCPWTVRNGQLNLSIFSCPWTVQNQLKLLILG